MVPMKPRRLLIPIAAGALLLASGGIATTALAVTSAPPPLVSKLSVKDKANATHWSIQAGLAKGKRVYGDATATYTAVPAALVKAAWIRDADKSKTAKVELTKIRNVLAARAMSTLLGTSGRGQRRHARAGRTSKSRTVRTTPPRFSPRTARLYSSGLARTSPRLHAGYRTKVRAALLSRDRPHATLTSSPIRRGGTI